MPVEGSIFDVPGFNMRLAGGGLQQPEITQPPPSNYVKFNEPFFGAPIAFAQCHNISGTDTPMTVPIYNIPQDSNIGSDQSAVPTVFVSGVSPDRMPWSTAEDIIRDIVREGPFDAGATPMDMEDSPLIITGICQVARTWMWMLHMGYSSTTPGFWSSLGLRSRARLNHSPLFLGEPLGLRMCYGGGRQPTERCWSHNVESSNSGTVRDVVTSDVVGNDEYWGWSRGLSGGRGGESVYDPEGAAGRPST